MIVDIIVNILINYANVVLYSVIYTNILYYKLMVTILSRGVTWSRSGYTCATAKSNKKGYVFDRELVIGADFFKSSLEKCTFWNFLQKSL
jgi:hypothetical protein